MKKIAIQDANILIDLLNVGMLDHCLKLNFHFTTTSIILNELNELQTSLIRPHILTGLFSIIDITEDELGEIQIISLEDKRLSEQDWSAIYYAKKDGAILITGDKRMLKIAESRKIVFHGILWLFDCLVEDQILSKLEASTFLERLISINPRLPIKHCKERLEKWYTLK